MSGKKTMGIFVALLVIMGSVIPLFTTVMAPPPASKTIYGQVFANASGIGAYNDDPLINGVVTSYIMNRTNDGIDVDVMKNPPIGFDHFSSSIHDSIPNWKKDDPCIVIISREEGTTGDGNRTGYVAYVNGTLDWSNPQQFDDSELRMIPVPTFDINGTTYINMSWTPLPDPNGLIAGYTLWRSTDNGTFSRVGGIDPLNPIMTPYYNDTSVAPGNTYYFALGIVFVGYTNNVTSNTDNQETVYFSEGSDKMNSTYVDWAIEEIRITDGPNGPDLGLEFLSIGESILASASGYNNTFGYYGLVEVEWTQVPTLGSFSSTPNTESSFTAGFAGGTTTITGTNSSLSLSDDFTITIRDPTPDYIVLKDGPDGAELINVVIEAGVPLMIYACGYNNTNNTYTGLVDVDWSEDNGLGSFDATPGPSVEYTGSIIGLTNITGENTSMTPAVSDSFALRVEFIPTGIDYIEITDSLGNVLSSIDLPVGGQVTLYASGFNTTGPTFIDFVEVDWLLTLGSGLGYIDTILGNSTILYVNLTAGQINVNATNGTWTDELPVTILDPTTDYVQIRDGPDGGGNDLGDPLNYPTYPLSYSTTFYGAAYNNTAGFIGPVPITAIWSSNDTSVVDVSTPGNTTTVSCNDTNMGWVIIDLDDGAGHTNSTQVTVTQANIDYIQIRDDLGGAGNVVSDPSYQVGAIDMFYGAAYNYTLGFIGDVPATSTWVSTDGAIVAVTTPGLSTTITCSNTLDGTITLTLDDGDGHTNTTLITVLEPTVDYIEIHDAMGGSGNYVDSGIYGLTDTDLFYAAAFNNTAGHIGEVSAVWSSSATTVGTVTTPGTSTTFTAQNIASDSTCIITATFGALSNSTGLLTVLAPTGDYIQIEEAAGGSGTQPTADTFTLGGTVVKIYHCAIYNNTGAFVGNGQAAWTVESIIVGAVDPASGTFTTFTATTAGTGYLNATLSGMTDSVTITVNPAGDTTPPAAPTGLDVQQVTAGGALNLVWTAHPDTDGDLAGYNVWRSTTNTTGSFVQINTNLITDATYSDATVTEGTTYYYYVTAVDDSDNESPESTADGNTADRDTDDDDIFDIQDDDDDGDGLLDTEEDTNGNGVWDQGETDLKLWDTDGDGKNDKEDAYPLDSSKWKKEDEEGLPIFLIILPIIIIVIVLILALLLSKKKKPEEPQPEEEKEMPPPPGAKEEALVEEEAPVEEAPPEEEAPVEEEPPAEEETPPEEEAPAEDEAPQEEAPPSTEEEAPEPKRELPPPPP